MAEATPYVPGMGTHHIRGGMTPAMLADPSFNRLNPILDSVGLDDKFDPARPEVLQYDGNGPDREARRLRLLRPHEHRAAAGGLRRQQRLVAPPPWICYRKSDAAMIAFNVSDASCTSQAGVNVNMGNYYMLHVWVLEDMKFVPDVYAGMIPCISGGTAVHDPNDPCHASRTGGASAASTARSVSATPATESVGFICAGPAPPGREELGVHHADRSSRPRNWRSLRAGFSANPSNAAIATLSCPRLNAFSRAKRASHLRTARS